MLGLNGLGLGLGSNVAATGGGGGGGGGGTFTPSDISAQLYDWFTADHVGKIDTTSTNVWTGESNSQVLTQATSSQRGTYSSTSPANLSFDTDDYLSIGATATEYDAFFVVTTNSSNADYRTLVKDHLGGIPVVLEGGSNRLGYFSGSFGDSGFTIATATMAIIHLRADVVGVDTTITMSVNGGTETVVGTLTGYVAHPVAVGNNNSGATQNFGKIHAAVITNALLSSTDRDKTIGYLAWHWSLQGSLPGGHPYKSAAP
jgi:hypothetical protein